MSSTVITISTNNENRPVYALGEFVVYWSWDKTCQKKVLYGGREGILSKWDQGWLQGGGV